MDTYPEHIEKRYKTYKFYRNFFSDIINNKNYVCLNNNGQINLTKYFKNNMIIGKYGKYGDVYKLYNLKHQYNISRPKIIKEKIKYSSVAIKLVPLEDKALYNKSNTSYLVWREVRALELVTELVINWHSQHFSLLYGYYICNRCEYINPELKDDAKMCILIITELSKYDLKSWLTEKKVLNIEEWYNLYFQIMSALHLIQNKYQLIHNDLHWENILIDEVKQYGYWQYIIDGLSYYLPNMGFICKITDFGKCQSISKFKINKKDLEKLSQILTSDMSMYDYNRLVDVKRISSLYKWIEKYDNIQNIPQEFYDILRATKKEPVTPLKFIKKYMCKYLHNKIGTKVTSYDNKHTKKSDDYSIGDIINYKNKYAIVSKIKGTDIIIITDKTNYHEILVSVKDIKKFTIKIEQNKNKYLLQNRLGVFIV